MKIINCQQGTHEWYQARLGMPTASKIGCIITPTGKETANAARKRYAFDLVAERLTKMPSFTPTTGPMQRGKDLEPEALNWYADRNACRDAITSPGFCVANDGISGCSPDALVGSCGGVEIKCPGMAHYLEIIGSGYIDPAWVLQCHHSMYVTGAEWWDFVLYTDVRPFSGWVKRITRGLMSMDMIAGALQSFADEVNALETTIRERAGITDEMMDFDPPIFLDDNAEAMMKGIEL